jgi:hypothetical protein
MAKLSGRANNMVEVTRYIVAKLDPLEGLSLSIAFEDFWDAEKCAKLYGGAVKEIRVQTRGETI